MKTKPKKTEASRKELELARAKVFAVKADYRSAMVLLRKMRKIFPGDFEVEFAYAKYLGDYADELPVAKRLPLKKEAIRILKPLLGRLQGKPADLRFGVRINFYYQSRRFPDLERVGVVGMKKYPDRGLYSAGCGSSLEAERLVREKSPRAKSRAIGAAKRAVTYWKKYFERNPKEDYYFPYTLLAMAEAILGEVAAMEKSLAKAAKVSGRKKDFWEFEEIRRLVSS